MADLERLALASIVLLVYLLLCRPPAEKTKLETPGYSPSRPAMYSLGDLNKDESC